MVLEEESRIIQSRNAHTQYITIPASIVRDSQYPFKAGEKIKIIIDPYNEVMIITSLSKPNVRIESEGIVIDKRKLKLVRG